MKKQQLKDGTFGIFVAKMLKGESPYVQTVFSWLMFHANEFYECFPSLDTLAKESGMSRPTVCKTLSYLEKKGFIKRTKRKLEQTSSYASSYYKIVLSEDVVKDVNKVVKEINKVVKEINKGCKGDLQGVVNDVYTNKNKYNQNQLTKKDEPLFDEPKIIDSDNYLKTNPSSSIHVLKVFEYWKDKAQRQGAVLDKNRRFLIDNAIRIYGLEKCEQAIDGCLMSDWSIANQLIDIKHIFKDAGVIEGHLARLSAPKVEKKKPMTALEALDAIEV